MQNEGIGSGQRLVSFGALLRPVAGRLRLREVWSVEAGPLFLLLVPPDELLAFAPGLAVRTRGRAVIEDAAVRRPGESPAVPVDSGRLPAVGPVPSRLGKDTRVDPAAASRRAVGFEVLVTVDELSIGDGPAVDLLEDLLGIGLPKLPLRLVVP